jgi:hypothetical protein
MTDERFRKICHLCIWPPAAIVLFGFAVWLFVIENDSPVLSFGAKANFFLTLDGDTPATTIHLDDQPKLALTKTSWLRACPNSKSEQFLQVDGHHRIDVAVHPIAYPGVLGPVPAKSRWIVGPNETMRSMSFGQTGKAVFWISAVSTCEWGWWSKKVTPVETSKFEFDILP